MNGFRPIAGRPLLLCAIVFHNAMALCALAGANPSLFPHSVESHAPSYGWLKFDDLIWWTRGMSVPPLVTSSPPMTDRADAGELGRPTTDVLFGDERVGGTMRNGFRVGAGIWWDSCQSVGLDFDFFALETTSARFRATSEGNPILARPYTDAATSLPGAELIGFPDFVQGQIQVAASTPGLWGWGLAVRQRLAGCQDGCCDAGARCDWILGYRHLRLDDRVTVSEQLTSPLFLAGTELAVEDRFSAQNAFHGLELGVERTEWLRRWELDYSARVALGWNASSVRIHGETTIESPGFSPVVHEGGFLALGSNSGRYDEDDFTAVFQVGTNLAYHLTDCVLIRVGYTLFYWPSVFRAGDQIDTVINPNLLPPPLDPVIGPRRPNAPLRDRDFWAQGLNLGLEYRF
jgi:hypothetical protein